LDEIETDVDISGQDVVWPWEEQRIADQWGAHFEKELEAHWTAQAKARKPVPVWNGQKIWASAFTGLPDVAYNLAYFQAVANGFTRQEVQKAAEEARDRAKRPWVANEYLVVGADERGVTLSDNTMMPWVQAANVVGKLSVETGRKEGLLDRMRRIYVQANGGRQYIAAVGKAIAGL
jgi:hypothetical protein